MNRIEQLEKEIQEYLDEGGKQFSGLERHEYVYFYTEIINNIDTPISIDSREDHSDRWGEATIYVLVSNKDIIGGYSIIIDNQVERMECNTVKEFAEYLERLEIEGESLKLTIK